MVDRSTPTPRPRQIGLLAAFAALVPRATLAALAALAALPAVSHGQTPSTGYRNHAALTSAIDIAETIRNRQFCVAQVLYLTAILEQIEHIGSRGGAIVLDPDAGLVIHPALPKHWRLKPENASWRQKVMLCQISPDDIPGIDWQDCRPVPKTDGWFETVWKNFREQKRRLLE